MSAVSETPSAASSQGATPAPFGGFRSWPRWSRWSTYGVGVVVLLLVAALVAGAVVVRDSFPQTDGDVSLPGLDGKVEVLRDDHGIPQIYAGTSHDQFYAQGFVQAQDRFFEMDVRRHFTAGRHASWVERRAGQVVRPQHRSGRQVVRGGQHRHARRGWRGVRLQGGHDRDGGADRRQRSPAGQDGAPEPAAHTGQE